MKDRALSMSCWNSEIRSYGQTLEVIPWDGMFVMGCSSHDFGALASFLCLVIGVYSLSKFGEVQQKHHVLASLYINM